MQHIRTALFTVFAFSWFAAVALSSQASADEKRVALVIGNSTYTNKEIESLANPKFDAADVSAALKALHFEVVTAIDTDKRGMDAALQKFARIAVDADSALFYYAGHALQYEGQNYLLPVDAVLEDDISLSYQTVSVDDVQKALNRTTGTKIIILDACRNNPLANRLSGPKTRGMAMTRGLGRIDKTEGMVVAFATASGSVAMDGRGRNSPFTKAFLNHLSKPGLEIERMLRLVTADVSRDTDGKQRPETSISLLNDYFLNQNDRIAWDKIKDNPTAAGIREFLDQYPNSALGFRAATVLLSIERREAEAQKAALALTPELATPSDQKPAPQPEEKLALRPEVKQDPKPLEVRPAEAPKVVPSLQQQASKEPADADPVTKDDASPAVSAVMPLASPRKEKEKEKDADKAQRRPSRVAQDTVSLRGAPKSYPMPSATPHASQPAGKPALSIGGIGM